MSSALSHKFFNRYSGTEWLLLKVSLVWVWLKITGLLFLPTGQISYPTGFCVLFDCSLLTGVLSRQVFYNLALLLSVFYLLEKWMKLVTALMFLLSLLMFTLEESNGIANHCPLFTLIFLAQSIAYFKGGTNLKKNRLQFAVQFVAASYLLAGISKITTSGLGWVTDAPQSAIQILKGYSYTYFDWGLEADLQQGLARADFVLQNKSLLIVLFAFSLFTELTVWIAVFSKRNAFIYGCMLLAMHAGIYYFMNILILGIFYPMVIILINPLYTGYFMLSQLYYWAERKPGSA